MTWNFGYWRIGIVFSKIQDRGGTLPNTSDKYTDGNTNQDNQGILVPVILGIVMMMMIAECLFDPFTNGRGKFRRGEESTHARSYLDTIDAAITKTTTTSSVNG